MGIVYMYIAENDAGILGLRVHTSRQLQLLISIYITNFAIYFQYTGFILVNLLELRGFDRPARFLLSCGVETLVSLYPVLSDKSLMLQVRCRGTAKRLM